MKAIVILIDTLNRHSLSVYNSESVVQTPNLERFARKSAVFMNHWSGSLPCMPARRDLFTGRLSFLERGWGGLEPFDVTLQEQLTNNGVFSHMVTDHYHYFATGGENYCQSFTTWDFHRGQEFDPWVSRVKPAELPSAYLGRVNNQYELNRQRLVKEEDYSGARTIQAACDWLEHNHDADQFMLMVEAFDPHEPFDCPQEYLDLYNDTYTGPRYNWPNYGPNRETPEATEHLRKRYAATLTMMDRWLGKLLDTIGQHNLWEDTLVILTTDHGFLLGEHEVLGKNVMTVYNELAHLPLMVHLPGGQGAGERIEAITQNIDLMPTLLEHFGIAVPKEVQGHSLLELLQGRSKQLREVALYGYFGMDVNMTDGTYTYHRTAESADNQPCFLYTALPTAFRSFVRRSDMNEVECGRFLPYTNYPVFKFPVTGNGPELGHRPLERKTLLFDIQEDYYQTEAINDAELEVKLGVKMRQALQEMQAPEEQLVRLGIT
ncbi:sulfatase [Paenibacillus radicis (ex Xue et al. 2023)]|uniref:Sulfatase n=1 Tax=Paenibacillus radicis (ex Xue et al. 2023) TaxID=2972489 RepID=A0ABT1YGE7_9BACL|nr:sulfatase [Paenibacillus radicis (ex Xue et al. 2023)]MCR8632261.1 sulfatase [Paenibacillus radicis (ex Xue et al. 2023)]